MLEGVERQVKDFEMKPGNENTSGSVNKITSRAVRPKWVPASSQTPRVGKMKREDIRCFKCGLIGHISTDGNCPARGKKCKNCGRIGHFESQCRFRKFREQTRFQNPSFAKKVRAVEEREQVGQIETESRENAAITSKQELKTYYAFYNGNETNIIRCKVGGIDLDLLVDSGADANLVSNTAWEDLKSKGVAVKHSEKGSSKVLKSYASDKPLTILGTFVADQSRIFKLAERRKKRHSLSFKEVSVVCFTAKRLGILQVGISIDQVGGKVEPLSKIKGIQVHIRMDPDAKPVFQPMRRLPVSLESAVNKKLTDLLARDVIEEKKGPAAWVSPLVVVGKANGEPRLCLDLRRVNASVLRERHPMPLIDDFLARVGKGMIRSKLDVKDSFLQLELDEESKDVMTFITNRGMFRFKRMPFGLVSAPEVFQRTMDEILVGCDGTWWYIDDIYIEGKTRLSMMLGYQR